MGEITLRQGLSRENIGALLKWANSGGEDFLHQFAGPKWRYPLTEAQVLAERESICAIYDGGRFAGIIQRLSERDRVAHIGRFLIDPARTGEGLGAAALRRFCDALLESGGVDAISLNVYLFNGRARRCYEKCGFRTTLVNEQGKPWPYCRMELHGGRPDAAPEST